MSRYGTPHLGARRDARLDGLDRRFGAYWRILLAHLLLFQFIYPTATKKIPQELLQDLAASWPLSGILLPPPSDSARVRCYPVSNICTISIIGDIVDARLQPIGTMSMKALRIGPQPLAPMRHPHRSTQVLNRKTNTRDR